MASIHLIERLLNRKPPPPLSSVRLDVCPPDLWAAPEPLWSALLRRLSGKGAVEASGSPLDCARREFAAAMDGLAAGDPTDLLRRAEHARSLRELWHLRSELYTLIGRRLSQHEADARLARVNRFFPTRATLRAMAFTSESGDA